MWFWYYNLLGLGQSIVAVLLTNEVQVPLIWPKPVNNTCASGAQGPGIRAGGIFA
jgi:hypothetical protein